MRQRPWVWVAAGFLVAIIGATWYINRVNSSHPAPWPMALGDAAHRSATESVFPTNQPKVLWAYPLDRAPRELQSPVVWTDGTVFLADGSKVVALGRNGERRWAWDSQHAVHSLALGRHGELYVHSGTTIYALQQDGAMVWQLPVAISERAPLPLIVGQGGVIYAGGEEFIYAIGSDGKTSWRFKADKITGGPVETPGGLVVLAVGEELYALDHNGDTVWHHGLPSGPYQLAAGPKGYIYVKGDALQVFDEKGTVVSSTPGDWTAYAVAVSKNFLQHGMRRFDLAGQKQIWDASQPAMQNGVVTIVDGRGQILVQDFGPTTVRAGFRGLHLLDADGKELWTIPDLPPSSLPAVTGDGRICYVSYYRTPTSTAPLASLVCVGEK